MRMAAQVQSSVCGSYLDDRCMMARDDFMELCNGGIATAAVSLGAIITALLLTVLLQ